MALSSETFSSTSFTLLPNESLEKSAVDLLAAQHHGLKHTETADMHRHTQTCADMRRHAQTCGCAKMRVPSNHPFKINHLNSILHYKPSSNLPRSWDPDFDSSSVSSPISSETCRMDVKASGLWSSKKTKKGAWCAGTIVYIYNIIYTYTHTYDYFILLLFNHTITISTFNIC